MRPLAFTDPYQYQAAIRAAEVEIFPTIAGEFRAELTQVNLGQLWMQRAHESLPRVYLGAVNCDRAAIGFLTEAHQPPFQHCGMDVSFGEIIVNNSQPMHRRTEGACAWGSMSLTPDDLAAAGETITGRELTVPSITHLVRPSPALMSRLLELHETVGQLAETKPEMLAIPQVAEAFEQELIHVMVRCLTEGAPAEMSISGRKHSAIIARFEEFLAGNNLRPVYLAEICAVTGASERMLRVCCQEHLGMGPIRYLWLRRMHLARRALISAEYGKATVTQIATDHGFWELGRFSIEYRALFGEPPSASLRRPPDDRQAS